MREDLQSPRADVVEHDVGVKNVLGCVQPLRPVQNMEFRSCAFEVKLRLGFLALDGALPAEALNIRMNPVNRDIPSHIKELIGMGCP